MIPIRLPVGLLLTTLFLVMFPADLHAQKVALLVADSPDAASDVRAHLAGAGLADVTVIDVTAGTATTPGLTELMQYDAVFTWSNMDYGYLDTDAIGNVLADYVDAGGGVVHAFFSLLNDPQRLGGRWDAESYAALSPGGFAIGFGMNFVPTKPLHPILSGVSTFNGGNLSLHLSGTKPQGCGEVVARWENGRPLAAARSGVRGGRVVTLNLYPASSNYDPQYWDAGTDGAQLMANALRFAADAPPYVPVVGPSVALVAADAPVFVNDVRCKLEKERLFSSVGVIDARTTTPALADLMPYHAVMTWPKDPYVDPAALGDVLADYVDQNRGVVQAVFGFSPNPGDRLEGRWQLGGYHTLTEGDVIVMPGQTLVAQVPDHPLLLNVGNFDGGTGGYHSSPIAPDPLSTLVASWSDGEPLAAVRVGPSAGRLAGLNFYPPSSDALGELWDSNTDGARLMANTLLYVATTVSNQPPTANAGSDQTAEATSPAGASFTISGDGDDPDDDSLTFTWSGAATGMGQNIVVELAPPPAPHKTHTYTLVLTVDDGHGGEATDSVDLTVTDTTGPALHGVPSGVVTGTAGPDGWAQVPYGPVTATDLVDGTTPVTCAPAAPFPVGDTPVTCSTSDSRGNLTIAQFTVHVSPSDKGSSGRAFGHGSVQKNGSTYQFTFDASQKPSGAEKGELGLVVKSEPKAKKARAAAHVDHFLAWTVDAVTFSGSTVLFSGVGKWNGLHGYRYEVSAADKTQPGRGRHDWVRIIIKAPGGAIVAQVDGTLSSGRIRVIPFGG
jgi:hypothetical protein